MKKKTMAAKMRSEIIKAQIKWAESRDKKEMAKAKATAKKYLRNNELERQVVQIRKCFKNFIKNCVDIPNPHPTAIKAFNAFIEDLGHIQTKAYLTYEGD